MIFEHKSVLLYETVDSLNIKPDGIYVDGTLGGGGRAFEVASRLGENGRLIGIDRDPVALKAAGERLAPYQNNVTLVHSNFCEIKQVLEDLKLPFGSVTYEIMDEDIVLDLTITEGGGEA